MILVLKIAAFICVAGAGLAYWLCHRAPEGQQDSRGFRPQVDEGAEGCPVGVPPLPRRPRPATLPCPGPLLRSGAAVRGASPGRVSLPARPPTAVRRASLASLRGRPAPS